MPSIAPRVLAEYKVGKTIGEGAFSKVKLGYHRSTHEKVAVKIISKVRLEQSYKKKEREKKERDLRNQKRREDKERREKELIRQGKLKPRPLPEPPKLLTSEEREQKHLDELRQKEKDIELQEHLPGHLSKSLSREVRLLQILKHPNIIRLYQVIETELEFYIITQFAGGGEIIDHIAKHEHLDETEARRFFREIVSAVDHCHLCGVLHRDLKLENILLSSEKHVLVSDFGLGRSYQQDNLCSTFCGTPLYAAPELVSGIRYFGPPADIWALGVVLFAMVCGKPPFQAETMGELYRKIKSVDYKFPAWCTVEFQDLIHKIFIKDPAKRLTMDGIRNHEWVLKEYGEPPFRLEPTEPIKQYNSSDSQVDNVKAIQYDERSMLYSFNEVCSSRDISRHRWPLAPLHSIESMSEEDGGLHSRPIKRQGSLRYNVPLDREEAKRISLILEGRTTVSDLNLSMKCVTVTSPPLERVLTCPGRAALAMRDFSNQAMDDLSMDSNNINSKNGKFRRISSGPPGLCSQQSIVPLRGTVQPLRPAQVVKRSVSMFHPPANRNGLFDSRDVTDFVVAAAAAGFQKPSRRRVSMSTIAREKMDVETSCRRLSNQLEPRVTEIKCVKGTFQLALTTVKFTPDELVAEVTRVLTMLNIFFIQ
eukprot:Ihof_evm1s725 gene=Ihof_evmTU1s725